MAIEVEGIGITVKLDHPLCHLSFVISVCENM